MSNYIITIARGLGSGGSHVARRLSKQLGIPYYDEEILEMASEYSGINEEYFEEANEKIKKSQLTINNSKGMYTGIIYSVNEKEYLSNENLFNFEAKVIKDLAVGGKTSCIIIGKAANSIIGSLKNVITVNIQAPLEYCVKNIMERRALSEKEATELIKKTNKYRRDYYKYYIGREWDATTEYDISLNTSHMGEEYATKIIVDFLNYKLGTNY